MEKWVDIQDLDFDVPDVNGAVDNSPDLPDLDRADRVADMILKQPIDGDFKRDLFYRLMGWDNK